MLAAKELSKVFRESMMDGMTDIFLSDPDGALIASANVGKDHTSQQTAAAVLSATYISLLFVVATA